MNFIKNNWFILLILILVIYLGYRYYMKIKANEAVVNNEKLANIKTGVKSESVTIVTPPAKVYSTINTVTTSYKVGDKIYAGATGVNVHDTPSVSSASLIKYYGKDEYIGTFVGLQSVSSVVNDQFVKIIVSQPYNSFLDSFGFQSNAVRFALSKQVYSK